MINSPGTTEGIEADLNNVETRNEDEAYTKRLILDGLQLAKEDDAVERIIGNLYISRVLKDQVRDKKLKIFY